MAFPLWRRREPIPLFDGQCKTSWVGFKKDSSLGPVFMTLADNIINYSLGPQELLLRDFFSFHFQSLSCSICHEASGSQSHLPWSMIYIFVNDFLMIYTFVSKFEKIQGILLVTTFSLVFQSVFFSKRKRNGMKVNPRHPEISLA